MLASPVVWCLLLFALLVGKETVRAGEMFSTSPKDDTVSIVLESSKPLFGSCSKVVSRKMNVRLQTLKTESGTIFRRKSINEDLFTCLSANNSKTLIATNIKECSTQTEAAGLEMFRWDKGLCTGYPNGIPVHMKRCNGANASVVLYSVDVAALASPVVSNIRVEISADITVDATWDVEPESCFTSYRVSFGPKMYTVMSDTFAKVRLENPEPCSENTLTVTPEYAGTGVVGPVETVTVKTPEAVEHSLKLYHGVSSVEASWATSYVCDPLKTPAYKPLDSYVVVMGNNIKRTDNSTFNTTFHMDDSLCTDTGSTLPPVSLTASDGTEQQVGEEVSLSLNDTDKPGKRGYTNTARCLYYETAVGKTYDEVLAYCQTLISTPPTRKGSDRLSNFLQSYTSAIGELEDGFSGTGITIMPHYVGLKKSSAGTWEWLGGMDVQPVPDNMWDTNEPNGSGDCVELRQGMKLADVSCSETDKAIVCYDDLVS